MKNISISIKKLEEKLKDASQKSPKDTSYETPAGKIFLIDKPLDFTSFDIVRIFKKSFNLKKAGHSGTLDPKATGLLIICSDKMTKKISEFIEYDKEYEEVKGIRFKILEFRI
jgi:tRNA U55 pseudouridine synthase TruB